MANISPSAGNLQARNVIIVKDAKVKKMVSEIALNQNFIAEAPVVFVVCANLEESALKYGKKGREFYSIQDATIFTSYLQLAITDSGLASCWVGAFNENELRDSLNLTRELKPIAIIPMGFSAEKPSLTSRKILNELIKKEF